MDNNTEQWVTFYRVYHHGLRCWLLVQKRDGCTRTVAETGYQAALQETSRKVLQQAA